MASKVDGQQLQDLVCPLCLDVFKNPTLLGCGHTFCRECLEAYDEQHRRDRIVCPVCRKTTNLGENRVAGLASNFLAKDMQDKLHVVAPSQTFCPMHKNTHNDIVCEDCKEFICLKCFLERHKDHKIKKKEELEGDLKEKRDFLIRESEKRKAKIEESVNNAERHIQGHFSNVEKEIKDAFARRVTILQQKEESLLNDLDRIKKGHRNQFEVCIANLTQAIDDINTSIVTLKGYTGKSVDLDTIKTQYLQCSELEKSLKRGIDDEPIVRLKQTAESTRFHPSDEKLLALGHIEVGVKEISNIQQAKTDTGAKTKSEPPARKNVAVIPPPVRNKSLKIVRQVDAPDWIVGMAAQSQDAVVVGKSEQLQTRRKVTVIPPPIRSKSLKIVRQVEAPDWIVGMAAQSQDAVVVGYGWNRHGSDRFLVSGEKTQHLKGKVRIVCDIACLTDGRSVVSDGKHTLHVYSTDGHSTGMQYTCKEGVYSIRLCVDQDDNIYAVNGNPEIYIFHGNNPKPQRVIPTGDIKPGQICVTKTGALITRNSYDRLNTLTVFDREGHVGSSITASDDDEYLDATVDSQDSVLVARVRRRSDVFRLTRYTLQGTTLIHQVTFNELKLTSTIFYCCMTSLAPRLIAFTNHKDMYFIELPV